ILLWSQSPSGKKSHAYSRSIDATSRSTARPPFADSRFSRSRTERSTLWKSMSLRFGDFAVDFDRRELSDRSGPLHLTPKAFELLQILMENRPRVVSQSELYDRLWPKTFVKPANLNILIRKLQKKLPASKPQIIRTNFEYAFPF